MSETNPEPLAFDILDPTNYEYATDEDMTVLFDLGESELTRLGWVDVNPTASLVGDRDGLPVFYGPAPFIEVNLSGDAIRRILPDVATFLQLGDRLQLSYCPQHYDAMTGPNEQPQLMANHLHVGVDKDKQLDPVIKTVSFAINKTESEVMFDYYDEELRKPFHRPTSLDAVISAVALNSQLGLDRPTRGQYKAVVAVLRAIDWLLDSQ